MFARGWGNQGFLPWYSVNFPTLSRDWGGGGGVGVSTDWCIIMFFAIIPSRSRRTMSAKYPLNNKKCANSTQRSQSPNSQRLTIASGKSKIYSPRQGYLSPGNSIVLVIAATLLFISVTIFCRFWELKHASNRPVYFRDLCVTTKILPVSHFNTCMQIY